MLAYYAIYVVTLLGVTICFDHDSAWRRNLQLAFFLVLLPSLALFAGLRSPHVDRDYENYLSWYETIASGPLEIIDWIKDPAFVIICYPFAKLRLSYAAALTIIVGIALWSKFCFAKLSSDRRWLTLFFYLVICRFFVAQEMTAIRVAAAVPLVSIGMLLAYRRRFKLAYLFFVLACTFHISVVLALPIFLLVRFGVRFRSAWWILSLIPIGIVLEIALRGLLAVLADMERLSPYLGDNPQVEVGSISLLSVYLLARTFVLALLLFAYWKNLSDEERMIVFSSACGVFFQMVFYSNDVLALRGAEIFGMFDILMFLIPLRHLRTTLTACYAATLVLLGAIFFWSSLKVINPYGWIF